MKQKWMIVAVCVAFFVLAGGLPGTVRDALAADYLMAWGMNGDDQASLVATNILEGVTDFSAGWYHNLAVKGGQVFAWGSTNNGVLDVPIAAFQDVVAVSAGEAISMALKSTGQVVLWGGSGITILTNIPEEIEFNATAISAGSWHALALDPNGGVVAWGSNTYGQCDVPVDLQQGVSAIAAGTHFSLALKEGAVHVFGIEPGQGEEYGIRAVPPEAANDVVAIAAGPYHALALKEDGSVVAWGAEEMIEDLDSGIEYLPAAAASDVMGIAAGYLFSMALKTNGEVVVWGDTINGQLPVPGFASSNVSKVSAGYGHCMVQSTLLPPRFITQSITNRRAYVHMEYSYPILAWGDPEPTFSASDSTIMHWMELSEDGIISGTPEAAATYPLTILASNVHGVATQSFYVVVLSEDEVEPDFQTASPLPPGTVGAPYAVQIFATGIPEYSWQDAGSGFPGGLWLEEDGWLTGIPEAEFDSYFWVLASNQIAVTTNTYALTVTNPPKPAFVTESPLPAGMAGQPYSVPIEVANYPASVSLHSGSLPAGLWLDDGWLDWKIVGTPTTVGSTNFALRAVNVSGQTDRTYWLTIVGPPQFVTTSPLTEGWMGEYYQVALEATLADSYQFVSGSLPDGMTLGTNGVLSGTPVQAGLFSFAVNATNQYGWDQKTFDLTINGGEPPEILLIKHSGGHVILEWTNYNQGGQIEVWMATNIVEGLENWSNLGVKAGSAWTNEEPDSPSYYRLRWKP